MSGSSRFRSLYDGASLTYEDIILLKSIVLWMGKYMREGSRFRLPAEEPIYGDITYPKSILMIWVEFACEHTYTYTFSSVSQELVWIKLYLRN